jgi:hypothetical protein
MFSTTHQKASITNFKPAKEMHGPEKRLVGDLKVTMSISNTVLEHLGKDLRTALYRKAETGEDPQADMLPLVPDGMTKLKNPTLKALAFDEKFPGYQASFPSTLAVHEVIKLSDVTLAGFTVEAKDGGTVDLSFNMRFPVDGQYAGKLCQLIQEDIELTLVPPTADALQADMDKAA